MGVVVQMRHHEGRVKGTIPSLTLLSPLCRCSPGYHWLFRLQAHTAGSCPTFCVPGSPHPSQQGCSQLFLLRLLITMAAVDRFNLLYREISRSCSFYVEALAIVGAWYTVRKCLTLVFDTYSMLRLHVIPKLVGEIDIVKRYGRWAVVTGSTDGIGKAYAEELAKRGVNIILISRSKEKLEAVSRNISETYKVETDFIVADFSKGREAYHAIKEGLKDREIGILVNNVGLFYTYPDYFTNLSEDMLWDMININIASANMMVHIVLPGMVEKKKGAIVNVSSASCCQPTPMLTIYGASKAYLDYFSRALYYEYASKGIFVQSLTPFVIATKMVSCSSVTSKRSFFFPSAEEYASHAISTLGLSKRTPGYWKHSLEFTLGERLPEWIWAWFAQYFCRIIRKEALTHKAK